ncbi:uncharacterized protein EDB91DRAFT_1249612 [Suillus paluster]|uniref:uncharacterized protein n=1 Tax=Suillus paluster TaxID=48578 RepID=UPI001B866E01|nr:uncharacterized protein EDB91DRAFT_1249612 [Suillus paluster]KAG1737480.1 hypothetical protein EDB91DRAFT_1249612 [Suillus paluster]
MGYNAHSPLASTPPAILSTTSRPPSASTSNSRSTSAFYQPPSAFSQPNRAPHLPPVAESPLAQFSRPAPLLTTRMPATSSSSQPAISSLSPPASSWPSLLHYAPIATPYSRNPRFSATQVSPGFSVPHAGIPMSTTAGRSRVHSNRKTTMPYSVSKPVKQVSKKQVDIVIFPNDIHAAPAAPDSIDNIFEDTYLHFPHRIHVGERLASDLNGLQDFGLVHRITLTASSHNEIIMNQVYNSVLAISTSHNIQFPPEPECSFDLDASAPNHEFQIQFQHLPFRLLKIGYQMPKGHYLSFDATETWQDYTFHALSKRVNQIQHPTDPNVGLLIICPKYGPLIGPIQQHSTQHHMCFANRAFKILIDADEEELEYQGLEPGDTIPVECKAFCPLTAGTSRRSRPARAPVPSPIDSDEDLYAPLTIPSTPDNQPNVLPSISSPATSLSSISSPSLNSLPALVNPQTSFPTVIDLTLPSPNHSSHSPPHSPIVHHHSVYVSPTPPPYETLLKVNNAIMTAFDSEVEHSMVHVHGPTVKACAEGLIDFLCQQQRNSDTPYARSYYVNERFSIQPHNQKLSDMFGKHWIFRAGYDGAHDASGEGVMRQVLTEALMLCLSESYGITQILDKHGFHVLCIHNFPTPSDIECAFALGAVCTMMMIRGHIAPDPISPALLIAAFAGVEALADKCWVGALFPDHYDDLGLLPSSPRDLTSSTISASQRTCLQRFIQGTIDSSVSRLAPLSDEQWPAVVLSLHTSTLLGIKPEALSSSQLFKAFQAGIDIQLSTTHKSVIEMLKLSSKWLLSHCYHWRITNGEQVISRLDFVVCGDPTFESATAPPLVVQLRSVFERYFRGIGHPPHPQMADLVNEAQRDIDNADPAYRACHFVKLLSRVTLLPPPGQDFTIYVHQTIPETVCFAGQYHRNDDLLPPSIHACNYSMDVWFNRKMMHILGKSPLSDSDIAELEFMLHCVVFDAGQDSFT